VIKAPHGGDFFAAIGVDLRTLERASDVVSADVLDAWYDPAPRILAAIRKDLEFLVRTSPPTHAEGLQTAISASRHVPESNLLVGSGTSSLMYACFPHLVNPGDKVVLLDPMYGEYRHIFENVIPCQVRSFELEASEGFEVDVDRLAAFAQEAKLVVLVNPNSPTGRCVPLSQIRRLLDQLPAITRVWIDETYIDFLPGNESLEPFVAEDPRIIVAKSMSKFYSLSGLRLGYLAMESKLVDVLEVTNPPWSVGLLAQLAGILALEDPYYEDRSVETRGLRSRLVGGLSALGLEVFPSDANFVLCRLPDGSAKDLVSRCAEVGVFLRDCGSISARFEDRYVRIAVKPQDQIERILEAIATRR